jgi:hypothetical protein
VPLPQVVEAPLQNKTATARVSKQNKEASEALKKKYDLMS